MSGLKASVNYILNIFVAKGKLYPGDLSSLTERGVSCVTKKSRKKGIFYDQARYVRNVYRVSKSPFFLTDELRI